MLVGPFANEGDQSIVNRLGLVGRQEVSAVLDNHQLGRLGVLEELDLLLGVSNCVHDVVGAVEPQDGALDVEETSVQPISIAEVDRRHSGAQSSVIAAVVGLDDLPPMFARRGVDVLAEPDVDEEVAEGGGRLEIRCVLGRREGVDARRDVADAVPAAQLDGALRLVVHGGAERDDTLDLLGGEEGHACGDPATLAGAEHESLLDAERLHHLEVHLGSVPVGPAGADGAGVAMAEELDGQQVHGIGQLLVLVLRSVQLDAGDEGIDEDQGGLGGVVGMGHVVTDVIELIRSGFSPHIRALTTYPASVPPRRGTRTVFEMVISAIVGFLPQLDLGVLWEEEVGSCLAVKSL
jgi:hypothetical protein